MKSGSESLSVLRSKVIKKQHDTQMHVPVHKPDSRKAGVIGEPAKYVLRASDGNLRRAPQHLAKSVAARPFLIQLEPSKDLPPGYKRCFLCATARTNEDCSVCSFKKAPNETNAVPFPTAQQQDQESTKDNSNTVDVRRQI